MGQRVAEHERGSALAGFAQLVEAGSLEGRPALGRSPAAARFALRHAAADDDAHAGFPRAGDPLLVPPLQRRVGDLHHVEHPPFEVGGQVRQHGGDADEAHLPVAAHLLQGVDQAAGLALRDAGVVELHHVDAVAVQPLQADLQTAEQVVPRPLVRGRVQAGQGVGAAALGGQGELAVPAAERGADPTLGIDVVVRGVDEVDAGIQHLVEEQFRRPFIPVGFGGACQRGAEPEPGHLQAGVAEGRGGKRFHARMIHLPKSGAPFARWRGRSPVPVGFARRDPTGTGLRFCLRLCVAQQYRRRAGCQAAAGPRLSAWHTLALDLTAIHERTNTRKRWRR